MNKRLKEIEERLEKRTPGNWKLWGMDVYAPKPGFPINETELENCQLVAKTYDPVYGLRTFNATFIAQAATDIRYLLDKIKEIQEELEHWRQEANHTRF